MSQTTYNIEGVGTLDLGRSLNKQQELAVVEYFHNHLSEIDFRDVPESNLVNKELCGKRISDGKDIYRPCCLQFTDTELDFSFQVSIEYIFPKNHRKAFAIKDFNIELL